MIISASYRTDIPTFYGEWFMHRLRAGYCKIVNPYNNRVHRVDLSRDAVDGFVFWTKNIGPFLKHLDEVAECGYPFVVQHAINGYPRALESSVIDANMTLAHMHRLHHRFGANVAVWRYDTILLTSLTPLDFHRENFRRLARALEGVTNEVVISFAQIYQKSARNMNRAAHELQFTWHDPSDDIKLALVGELCEIAAQHGMQLAVCAQRAYVASGAVEARCIDAHRLSTVAGRTIKASVQGNRPECACFASRDIGAYDTCPHGCVYCYAVQNQAKAQARFRQHDPLGEFLFTMGHQLS